MGGSVIQWTFQIFWCLHMSCCRHSHRLATGVSL